MAAPIYYYKPTGKVDFNLDLARFTRKFIDIATKVRTRIKGNGNLFNFQVKYFTNNMITQKKK